MADIKHRVEKVYETCLQCGNDTGFYILLQRIRKKDVGDFNCRIRLKCPRCHSVFDVNLLARLDD